MAALPDDREAFLLEKRFGSNQNGKRKITLVVDIICDI